MKRPRLLLADDHPVVIAGLRELLEPQFEVVGIAEDGQTLVKLASDLKPDVILLDISMPLLNGLTAARQIKKSLPKVKLIFLTMHADIDYVKEAFLAGAFGYILKRSVAWSWSTGLKKFSRGGPISLPSSRRASKAPCRDHPQRAGCPPAILRIASERCCNF